MIRYEANIDGTVEGGEVYTDFNEIHTLIEIFEDLGWQPHFLFAGRGGYSRFEVTIESKVIILHIYLKKLTFGGRENRPYEKRAQFSAAIDRTGFDIVETENEFSLMISLYKREKYSDTIICAWDIHDWGYNIGRAFNCFVDIKNVAKALKNGFSQHKTSIGQVACCFQPKLFGFYIKNIKQLHKRIISEEAIEADISNQILDENNNALIVNQGQIELPKFENLFQIILEVLRLFDGIANSDEIETKVAEMLELPEDVRYAIHNASEGYRTELGYRLAWARYYLKRAGLIENPKRSIWCLTELGKNTLVVNKEEIKQIATTAEISSAIEKDLFNDIKTEENNFESEIEVDTEEIDIDFSEIENPFDPNKVDIKTKTMSLDLILKRLDREEIEMETNFQRKSGLWNNTKQSRLIESILIKFPLPAFYFDGSNDDKWLVVDGLQRLSSLDNFVNKKSFSLQNLEFLNQFNNKTFTELPGSLQRRIEEFEITAYIISPGTPKALKYNVFKRINTGGLTLTAQEIRNAIFQGKPADFVKSLAELRSFKQATAFSIQEDRMLDREFTTRFLAFYITPLEEYKSDLESFLNTSLEKIYSMEKEELNQIESRFNNAMLTALKIFGDDAFRKRFRKDGKRKPINKALFEVWSVLLSKLNVSDSELLIQKTQEVKDMFMDLLNNDEEFNLSISSGTGDKSRVKKRFLEINKIIQSILP